MTYLETCTDARKEFFKVCDNAIKDRSHNINAEENFACPNSTKPTMEMWDRLAEDDKDFQSYFIKLFANPAVKEADDEFTLDSYNNCVNMELIKYDKAVKERLNEKYTEETFACPNSTKTTMDMGDRLAEDKEYF